MFEVIKYDMKNTVIHTNDNLRRDFPICFTKNYIILIFNFNYGQLRLTTVGIKWNDLLNY